jgi:Protein of unknown function (DUF1217)
VNDRKELKMSANVNLNAPSYLPTLLGPDKSGTSLLSTLSGYHGQDTEPPVLAEAAEAGPIAAEPATEVARELARELQARSDISQFIKALVAAKTPAQLLADPAALKVLLTANGLGDQAGDTVLATQALLADPANANSMVNKLADQRWLSVNQTYAFASKGLSILNSPGTISAITAGYVEVLWRTTRDLARPGSLNAPPPQQAGLVV